MKNRRFYYFLITLIFVTEALLLCGCGSSVSSGDLIGVWSGSWEYEGKQINESVQFDRNGEYISVLYENGTLSSHETGTYVINKNEVSLQKDGNPGSLTPYKYNKGKLINGGHSLTKETGTTADLRSLLEPDVESLIQGTWEYYDSYTDFGERCTFIDGHYSYTSFMKNVKGVDRTVEGTYQIKDERIYINSDYYFDYKLNGSEIELSITPDGGQDEGIPRVFQKIE